MWKIGKQRAHELPIADFDTARTIEHGSKVAEFIGFALLLYILAHLNQLIIVQLKPTAQVNRNVE